MIYLKKGAIIFAIFILLLFPVARSEDILEIEKKTVALTFDDGPSDYTNDILDLLDKHGAYATFFVIGNKALIYKETVMNIVAKGNEIGNHTYSHPWLTHLSVSDTIQELDKTNDLIFDITGTKPTLFRPSYGDINIKVKKAIDMEIVMWNNDSNDWRYRSSKSIAARVIKNISDGDIIIMHDTYKRSYEALKIIIPKLKEMDYQIVTVSQLKEIRKLRDGS